ncbi:MAG: hypothetical protein WD689_02735 [Gaiellaceae bacterium]
MHALGLLAVVAAFVAPAAPAATVIDRTLLCEVGISGGVRKLKLYSSSAIREGPQQHAASVDVSTNLRPTWRLAAIGEGSLELSPACTRSSATVPLSARGLDGGAAGIFGDEHGCLTPRRVLLRVRATFTSRVTLRRGSPYGFPVLFARGTVEQASLAIRTQAGKPLAYATVSETGKARLFTAGSCTAE